MLTPKGNEPALFLTMAINLVLFIVPGLGWLGLINKKKHKSPAILFFTVFIASALIVLLVNITTVLFYKEVTSLEFLIFVIIFTNLGLILYKWDIDIKKIVYKKINKKFVIFSLCFLLIYIFLYFQAGYRIPPLQDNTLTVQSTAYGLTQYLRPYVLHDDGVMFYNFAHPLLLHFYVADSILLCGHLKQVKYYYDYSLMTKRIQEKGPSAGEIFPVYISENNFLETKIKNINGNFLVLDKEIPYAYLHRGYPNYKLNLVKDKSLEIREDGGDFLIVDNKLENKNIITRSLYEQIMLRRLLRDEYNRFYANPHLLCTRAVNIFFIIAALGVIIILFSKLFWPPLYFNLLILFLYSTAPELIFRSVGGSYTAISNFFLIGMAYLYLIESGEKHVCFSYSLLAGMADHKLVIFPLALLTKKIIFRDKNISSWFLVAGFLCGLFIYWIYGASVDLKMFYIQHFRHHLINRIFHVSDLGYSHYPRFFEYWMSFANGMGLPVFILGIISLILLIRNYKLNIFSFWFFVGALSFSLVDWKETKHLNFITIPLIFAVFWLLHSVSKKENRISFFLKIIIITIIIITIFSNCYFMFIKNIYLWQST